ncbi:hypothetical protein CDAR_423481 [Caerostris darwini]|uniref:Maturase K n=1 Tax=Caerostris darwini TaxID=1538125 RepID=A0AAV4U2A9_9ARAC|nr:hypothetical protein CDAR_423481 [Caerostris darwini]
MKADVSSGQTGATPFFFAPDFSKSSQIYRMLIKILADSFLLIATADRRQTPAIYHLQEFKSKRSLFDREITDYLSFMRFTRVLEDDYLFSQPGLQTKILVTPSSDIKPREDDLRPWVLLW